MQPESIKDGRGNRQREALDAPGGTSGSQTVGAGTQERGTREDWERSAEPSDGAHTEPPSNEAPGTQERGTLEDWERSAEPGNEANTQPPLDKAAGTQDRGTREDWERSAGPGKATQAAADAPSTTGGSTEQTAGDRTARKEPVTLRDGTLRD